MTTLVDSKLIVESEQQQQVTNIAADSNKKPTPLTALKRPLSAYNIYFQLERKRLLNGEPERVFTLHDAVQICDGQRFLRSLPKRRRAHRRTHGKVSFQQMARGIANSWKSLDDNHRQAFEDCAAMEKKRYLKEKKILKKAIAAQGGHTAEIAAVSPVTEVMVSKCRMPHLEDEELVSSAPSVTIEVDKKVQKEIIAAKSGQVKVIASVSPISERTFAVTEPEVIVPKCSMPHVEDKESLSGVTSSTTSVTVEDDMMTDGLETIDYQQAVAEDDQDVFYQTHESLMQNLIMIKERQAILQIKEQSLRLKVQQRQMLQQIRNGQINNSTMNSLRASKPHHQMQSLKTMLYNSPSMTVEGLFKNVTMKSYGHRAMNSEMINFLDYPYGIMDDADDSSNKLADDVFTREDNTLFSSLPMVGRTKWFDERKMKDYGQDFNIFDTTNCFDNSNSELDDSYDSVYDNSFNIADDAILSRTRTVDNEGLFNKLPMKSDGLDAVDFGQKYSYGQLHDNSYGSDYFDNDLEDDIFKIADNGMFSR